ncbi:hypothetical protein [Streptomyces sp. CB01881]|uniref:hypothetical protein n=1 Tax=Streptomyces sp. CB01881 TaxID=2078691 RepID=UPI000CDCBB46|nr:hypothetical protein [Streptomyces sp. CB01881]AUY48328.1 hypothetical protein C2142_04395 [Streptomyces sp. CB01881]TYC76815.1 hypothetical protein EH183_04410 [Streptomyces sp. CB01881]
MEIVYASLIPRQPGGAVQSNGRAEVMDALWAHSVPSDGLQHISARPEPGRVDLLLYLLTLDSPGTPNAVERARTLITRSHQSSPWLNLNYLPPVPLTAHEGLDAC